jgi:hypothetical protein
MPTIYVCIGNSDDKLSQRKWSKYVDEVSTALLPNLGATGSPVAAIHGCWHSLPDAPWQNACWCVEVVEHDETDTVEELQDWLREIAGKYGQDSVAWAEATTTFLRPATRATS